MSSPPTPASNARAEVSSEEVEALLGEQAAPAGVAAYPLGAPEKLASGRMPAFDRLNERWVKDFARELAERLRKPLEASVGEVQLMPYADWQAAVAPPSFLNVCTVPQWSRNAVIAVDGQLTFVLVDGYFGGAGSAQARAARSALARTEQRLAKIIVELFIKLFRAALAPVAAIDIQPGASEENPQYVAIAAPSDTVAVVRVDVTLNGQSGAVSLVVPQSCLEPLRDKLTAGPSAAASSEAPGAWRGSLAAQLENAEVELVTVLLETELSVRELLQLQSGDILPVDMPSTATLYAGSRPLLLGKFGVSRGWNAVSVTEAIKSQAQDRGVPRR